MEKVQNKRILFIEDDTTLLNSMSSYFNASNNIVFTAKTLDIGRQLLLKNLDLDMIILDLMLPDGSGLDIFKTKCVLPPVIILSDLSNDENIASGFEQGATDYIVKPCSLKLLEMRIALRLLPTSESVLKFGSFIIDSALRTVKVNDTLVSLTPSEFNILYFLVSNKGRFFSANAIYESVWNAQSLNSTTIKRHISTLRQKLKALSPSFILIETKFDKGYRFIEK